VSTATVPLNTWSHVAVTWSGGGPFTCTFYVNGIPMDTLTNTESMPANSDPIRIGGYQAFPTNLFVGYIDEVRIWEPRLTKAQIQRYMFTSCRNLPSSPTVLAAWNFDGNLNNFSAYIPNGINGSFNNGVANNARLSGYRNEAGVGGPPSVSLISHPTVLYDQYFPNGYSVRAVDKPITDLSYTRDTLYFATPTGPVTKVQDWA
jgi:hypothetical protein